MSEQEEQHYWDIKDDDGLLNLLDPKKEMHVYVKWDDSVHIWYYDDRNEAYDHDTGLEDHSEWGFKHKSNFDLYRIVNIDEEIARLQALRSIAVKWFAERGKRWPPDWEGYGKGEVTIEQAQQLPEQGKQV